MFLLRLVDALDEHKLSYAIAGGYAVALHGAVRGTIDIDLVLPLSERAFIAVEEVLLGLGLKPHLPITAKEVFRFRREYITNRNLIAWSFVNPDRPSEIVDILIIADLRKCKTKLVNIMGRKVRILSLRDLIKMKQSSGRLQDQQDVEALKKISGWDRRRKS